MPLDEDIPWLIGGFVALVFFVVFEVRALRHSDRQNTLSRFIYSIAKRWPISLYFAGLFTGLLIVHLFQHWCPS
jgi:hypothetical protein